jgi:hypothetical protein
MSGADRSLSQRWPAIDLSASRNLSHRHTSSMKSACLAALLALLPAPGMAQYGVESSKNLGYGFRREVHAEPSNSSFESIGHFAYLYYQNRRLGQEGEYSIAPGGKFLILQGVVSGNLFLFRRADEKITRLTTESPGVPTKFVWSSNGNEVEVQFEKGTPARKFPVQ